MNTNTHWSRFQHYFLRYSDIGFSLDISRMNFRDEFLTRMAGAADAAVQAMKQLEGGAIANPDENRMVGHYWLRAPELAPTAEIREAIERTRDAVLAFAREVHSGAVRSASGEKFTDLLLIGIGGSALGPQLVADALGGVNDAMQVHFFDNTDPDGMARVLAGIGERLRTTLVAVISKSGGTKETRNGMLVAQEAYRRAGLAVGPHFVAVTGEGSELDRTAAAEGWLRRFPMFDWVGGRTSVMSAVGLLPMALQGLDVLGFLEGARRMDAHTRTDDIARNMAMLLALMWYYAGDGRGVRDMVILPYKDRLLLMSRYLQQLVMESLGKELDLDGNVVNQGIAVYGNKGSTDQHAFVQQLRDGLNNFFVTFLEVREPGEGDELEVEPGIRCGDYLQGFLRGTREALSEKGRESVTISLPRVDAQSLGALIALFDRAVGFYASLININAYHQPGVEAGKKAAARSLQLQRRVEEVLRTAVAPMTVEQVALEAGCEPEEAWHLLVHLAASRPYIRQNEGRTLSEDTFVYLK